VDIIDVTIVIKNILVIKVYGTITINIIILTFPKVFHLFLIIKLVNIVINNIVHHKINGNMNKNVKI
jgi:hypothetical protein